jgi:hypothetical protein
LQIKNPLNLFVMKSKYLIKNIYPNEIITLFASKSLLQYNNKFIEKKITIDLSHNKTETECDLFFCKLLLVTN